jgi:hypothetical protein
MPYNWGPNSENHWDSDETYIPPQEPKKIKPKIVKVKIDLADPALMAMCSSTKYFKSCKGLINKINAHFEWDKDILPIRKYEDHYEEIIKFILDNYTIRDNVMLGSRTAHIIYIMKLSGYNGSFINKQKALYHINIPTNVNIKQYDAWEVLKGKIKTEMDHTGNASGYMVLLCCYHGYPLRIGDIALTNIYKKDNYHHLDLQNKIWTINADKTKNRRYRQFNVSDEFVAKVKESVHESGWLVCRQNTGKLYKAAVSMNMLQISSFTINEVRNSFETWNYSRDNVSEAEKELLSINILGHTASTARAYYTPLVGDLSSAV